MNVGPLTGCEHAEAYEEEVLLLHSNADFGG
jgi:hypothetical protein